MSFIAVICGLKSEAQAVSASVDMARVRVGVSGANAACAEEIAKEFCNDGARAVISVGVSGGLDPALAPGDLIIGEKVITDGGLVYVSDRTLLGVINPAISGESREERGEVVLGALFGADVIIDSAFAKANLFQKHKCVAVDMESHGAARAAARAGVPFLAIRAIADPADRALPPAALGAVAPDGSTRVLKTLGAALRDPKQFPDLMKLGADSAAAIKTLRQNLGVLFDRLFLSLDL